MLVFDASGSMSSKGWGEGSETAHTLSRIDMVRYALARSCQPSPGFVAWGL
jgi:hypothetical protein